MSTIDDMLRAPTEKPLPPLARWAKERLEAGEKLSVELHRSGSALDSSTVELFIYREKDEGAPRSTEWNDELNSALVELGVRAIDLNNEGERFALGLRAGLRKVERRAGDGYLNAVLLDLIDDSDLGKTGEIAEVRKHVDANRPERTRVYSNCREEIANEIGARATELREKLKYGDDDLRKIMSKAIARYLDDRFSVSTRRAFGWL